MFPGGGGERRRFAPDFGEAFDGGVAHFPDVDLRRGRGVVGWRFGVGVGLDPFVDFHEELEHVPPWLF